MKMLTVMVSLGLGGKRQKRMQYYQKRFLKMAFITGLLVFGLCGTALAGYTTTQLASNGYDESEPQINVSVSR